MTYRRTGMTKKGKKDDKKGNGNDTSLINTDTRYERQGILVVSE